MLPYSFLFSAILCYPIIYSSILSHISYSHLRYCIFFYRILRHHVLYLSYDVLSDCVLMLYNNTLYNIMLRHAVLLYPIPACAVIHYPSLNSPLSSILPLLHSPYYTQLVHSSNSPHAPPLRDIDATCLQQYECCLSLGNLVSHGPTEQDKLAGEKWVMYEWVVSYCVISLYLSSFLPSILLALHRIV